MNVLLTGGAGYIGSHILIELANNGHDAVVFDSFANSSEEAMRRVQEITGKPIVLIKGDCTDKEAMRKVFDENQIDAAIHLAGLKAVGESVSNPLKYYRNNLDSALTLLEVMTEKGVKQLVFSSSATVYGDAPELPLTEDIPINRGVTNPYGETKCMIERICEDVVVSDPTWNIAVLRYANPIGAHESGKIGEDPNGVPANILPFVTQVAVGKRDKLYVFGNDYPTPDGTCIRDYIHITDLAKGHIAALEKMKPTGKMEAYNISTGKGTSVMELVKAFEEAAGVTIPYEFAPRRAGDLPESYLDNQKALKELGWKTEKTILDGCKDSWRWQSQNPNGYKTEA